MQETLLEIRYFERGLWKNLSKGSLIFSFALTPFLWTNLANFDHLIQSGFCVIPKITLANICKPNLNLVIISVSSDPLNLEEKKLQKIEYHEKIFLVFKIHWLVLVKYWLNLAKIGN